MTFPILILDVTEWAVVSSPHHKARVLRARQVARIPSVSLDLESRPEDILDRDIAIAHPDWMIVGRQVITLTAAAWTYWPLIETVTS
jgi:hypothetical protein